jgi:acetyl-CoA carboxylase beta subunit
MSADARTFVPATHNETKVVSSTASIFESPKEHAEKLQQMLVKCPNCTATNHKWIPGKNKRQCTNCQEEFWIKDKNLLKQHTFAAKALYNLPQKDKKKINFHLKPGGKNGGYKKSRKTKRRKTKRKTKSRKTKRKRKSRKRRA